MDRASDDDGLQTGDRHFTARTSTSAAASGRLCLTDEEDPIPLIGMTVLAGTAGPPPSDGSTTSARAGAGGGHGGAPSLGTTEHGMLQEHYHKMMISGERGHVVEQTLNNSTVMSLTTPLLRRMLIKRLAKEVKTLYCVLELDDAMSLLTRHNSDAEKPGIDLVILELDRSTQNMAYKIMEHLAIRATLPGLGQTAIIPVVMLLHDDVDVGEQLQHCQELGLAGFLEETLNRKDLLMFFVGDIVRRYQSMHSVFQTVRNLRVFKYPYFATPEAEVDEMRPGDRTKKTAVDDDSVTSADSWSVNSDSMEILNQEHRIYKHVNDDDTVKVKATHRGSKYLVGLIRHKIMPTIHLLHLYDICDPRARPKLYREATETSSKGVDINTSSGSKFALTQVSQEMAPFVQKEKPHGNMNKSARGVAMSRLTAAVSSSDPSRNEARPGSFIQNVARLGSFIGGSLLIPGVDSGKRLRTDDRATSPSLVHSMAEEEANIVRQHLRTPSQDGFPGILSQEQISTLKRVSKDSKVDLLQYDIVVPEPLEIKSQAVNNFVCKGFKFHRKGQVDKAMPYYQYAVQLDPESPTGYFYRGVAYDNQKDYLRALKDFNMALKYNAITGELCQQVLLFNRSVMSTKLGLDHYAIADLNQALLTEPRDTMFLANRAMIHRRHGRFYAATDIYKKLWAVKKEELKKKDEQHPPPARQVPSGPSSRAPSPHSPKQPARTPRKTEEADFLATKPLEKTTEHTGATPRALSRSGSSKRALSHHRGASSKSSSIGGRQATADAILKELAEDAGATGGDRPSTTQDKSASLKRQETARVWRSRPAVLETTHLSSLTMDFSQTPGLYTGDLDSASPTSTFSLQARDRREKLEFRAVINNAVSVFDATFGCPTPLQEALTTCPKTRSKEQVEVIVDELRQYSIFYDVDNDILRKAAVVMEYRVMQEDKVIALQGHSCDALYIIMRGKVSAKIHSKDESHVNQYTLVQGDAFGDLALVDATRPINYHTYISEEPSEVMMLLKHDFDRLLSRHCFERLKARYIALRRLKLFQGWSTTELTRLARMSHVMSVPAKTTILQQSDKPAYLYVLLKGTCQVTKVPSRNAELIHKKMQIENQIMRIKTKYAYHHSIKPKRQPKGDPRLAYMTHTEIRHQELLQSLAKVEEDLRSLGREKSVDEHAVKQDLRILTPPAIFGEEGILDPQQGIALASFVSDTRVELLLIHKIVFQTFQITDSFLTRMQSKAIIYPTNQQVIDIHKWEQEWKAFREDLILCTAKERWPVSKSQIHYMAGGRSYIQENRKDQFSFFTKFS